MGAQKRGVHFERRESIARELGYPDWEQLIEGTLGLTAVEVGTLTGFSAGRISWWRNHPGPSARDIRREETERKIRELAKSAVMLGDIAEALGTHTYLLRRVMLRMPDREDLQRQVLMNREAARDARYELLVAPKPACYVPTAEEVSVFINACATAQGLQGTRSAGHALPGSRARLARDLRDAILVCWIRNGLTVPEIAQYTGHSADTVGAWSNRCARPHQAAAKPARFTPTPQEISAFREAVMLAQQFTCTTPVGSPVWRAREARDATLIEWRWKGATGREMATYSGRPVSTVRMWIKELIRAGRIPSRANRSSEEG